MEKKNRLSLGGLPIVAFSVALCSPGCYSSSTSIGAEADKNTDSGSQLISDEDTGQPATTADRDTGAEPVDREDSGVDSSSSPPRITLVTDRLDGGSLDSGQGYVFPELIQSQADTGTARDASSPSDAEYDAGKDAFIGGLPPGERAPAPGEVPGNVYGGPSVPWGPYDWGFPDCDESGGGGWGMSSPEGAENGCIFYALCDVGCDRDSDCDDGGSGNATPRCNPDASISFPPEYAGSCELICDSDTVCPEGMACVSDVDKTICMWPSDVAQPGCPAWCELDPLPRGCPGWCAVAGVGCDPEAEGYCCDGLVCGSEGWCVEESK